MGLALLLPDSSSCSTGGHNTRHAGRSRPHRAGKKSRTRTANPSTLGVLAIQSTIAFILLTIFRNQVLDLFGDEFRRGISNTCCVVRCLPDSGDISSEAHGCCSSNHEPASLPTPTY